MDNETHYVYVYIDPRNFEEFYYGQGKGDRKFMHLSDDDDSEKTRRIKAIKDAGCEPIIRVIAKNLTKDEALLVEKTLIWKLGRALTNISGGHFAAKFRPKDSFHLELNGFDFLNGIYFVNVGEGETRAWEDCRKYNFVAAGQGVKYSNQVKRLKAGDIIAGYHSARGYVGIGAVLYSAVRINDFKVDSKPLSTLQLSSKNIFANSMNADSEFLVGVKWIKHVSASDAKWRGGLFSTRQVVASLDWHQETLHFLEEQFNVDLSSLMS